MSYALLWIEFLLLSLIWVAAVRAFLQPIHKSLRGFLIFAAMGLPFLLLAPLTLAAATAKFTFHLQTDWYSYMTILTGCYALGALLIAIRGPRVPRARAAIAFLAMLFIFSTTYWIMDLSVRSFGTLRWAQDEAVVLAVYPPPLPDNRNAAIIYQNAFDRIRTDPLVSATDWPPDSPDDQRIPDYLKRQAMTIPELHQAAALDVCRFDHDYANASFSMLLPELGPAYDAALLLQMHAREELAAGRIDSAVSDTSDIFALSRHIAQQPCLVTVLVSLGIHKTALETLQDILPAVTDIKQLNGITLDDPEEIRRRMTLGTEGEAAIVNATYAQMATGELNPGDFWQVASGNTSPNDPKWSGVGASLYRVFLIRKDMEGYATYMDTCLSIAPLPYFQIRDRLIAMQRDIRHEKSYGPISAMLIPAIDSALRHAAVLEARQADAIVAIALTRYRLDHGKFPAKLADLVPEYLDAIPIDPFDGNPLRSTFKENEWTIYSIGPDGKDDGGVPMQNDDSPGDIPFIVKLAPK
jgi:hypothetical protein